MKPRILCVCTMGLNRSKYLAKHLRGKGYKTRYGGIGPLKYNDRKDNPIKKEDVKWAEIIIAAREKHRPILKEKFGVKNKKIIVLDVTDSMRLVVTDHPELANLDKKEFNKKWTYPQLRKALKPYLPLKK